MPTLIVSFTAIATALAAGLVAAAVVPTGAVVPAGAVVPLGATTLPAGRVAAAAELTAVVAAGALVAAGAAVVLAGAVVPAGFGVSVAALPPQAASTAATLPAAASFSISRRRTGRPAFISRASSNECIVFPSLHDIVFRFPGRIIRDRQAKHNSAPRVSHRILRGSVVGGMRAYVVGSGMIAPGGYPQDHSRTDADRHDRATWRVAHPQATFAAREAAVAERVRRVRVPMLDLLLALRSRRHRRRRSAPLPAVRSVVRRTRRLTVAGDRMLPLHLRR